MEEFFPFPGELRPVWNNNSVQHIGYIKYIIFDIDIFYDVRSSNIFNWVYLNKSWQTGMSKIVHEGVILPHEDLPF